MCLFVCVGSVFVDARVFVLLCLYVFVGFIYLCLFLCKRVSVRLFVFAFVYVYMSFCRCICAFVRIYVFVYMRFCTFACTIALCVKSSARRKRNVLAYLVVLSCFCSLHLPLCCYTCRCVSVLFCANFFCSYFFCLCVYFCLYVFMRGELILVCLCVLARALYVCLRLWVSLCLQLFLYGFVNVSVCGCASLCAFVYVFSHARNLCNRVYFCVVCIPRVCVCFVGVFECFSVWFCSSNCFFFLAY